MVLPGSSEERWMIPSSKSPKRLKLHFRDFAVSPHDSQKRCAGDVGGEGRRSPATKFNDSTVSGSSKRMRTPTRRIDEDYDYRIEKMRKKPVFDWTVNADRMHNAILGENKEKEEAQESPLCDGGSEKKHKCSSTEKTDGAVKLSKRRRVSHETQRTKLSVQLSREEVEEDFMKITGRRLPRKPNKRPSVVQKKLDTLFPGLWLTEVTADLYKVPESPPRHCWKRKTSKISKANDV
ncbi:hypothetical protein VNO77_39544 [Canavalia gladiata]|uniref:Uncharacterized protein n=1 Tax=Canavalia gladiata TaxID=3824 RepID=A0AAN9JWY0_CANGL